MAPQHTKVHQSFVDRCVANTFLWLSILVAEVFIYGSYGVLINLSRIDGRVEYQSCSLVLCIEAVKLTLALVMAWPELSSVGLPPIRVKNVLPFFVPAVCYCFSNNLAVYMQDQMDPATFQVMSNLKIASTALFYRLIMKREMRNLQWLSIGLLFAAGGLNSYSSLKDKSLTLQEVYVTVKGLIMGLVYCSTSGFAGVYTEYILKRDSRISLPVQSCFLYSFGIVINLIMWFFQADAQLSFFHGYTMFTWAVVITQALNGLVMSLIMKHSNNIVRLIVISSSIPAATLLSVAIFNLQPSGDFYLIAILVMFAVYLYNYVPK